ncbi:MAG: hypothetical protein JXB48_22465 [Candidatus Latescibacteria bacterium]|nr:hypothetical protein [Candidatus Latescibacterota bacterium]
MATDNKVVVFIDILGFAALTKAFPIDINLIKANYRLLSPSLSIDTIFKIQNNQLVQTFSQFHSSLQGVLNLANMRHSLTAITFSDSAFVATSYAFEAVNIAIDLIHTLLPQKIPVRMGIAYGSFATVRFCSDVTSDSANHSAQFLGTAIVHAHETETCGIKGLRILLHPSIIPLLSDIQHNPLTSNNSYSIYNIECSENEQENKIGIKHEINYWDLKPTRELARIIHKKGSAST